MASTRDRGLFWDRERELHNDLINLKINTQDSRGSSSWAAMSSSLIILTVGRAEVIRIWEEGVKEARGCWRWKMMVGRKEASLREQLLKDAKTHGALRFNGPSNDHRSDVDPCSVAHFL